MIKPVSRMAFLASVAAKGFRPAEGVRDHTMFFFWLDGQITKLWVKLSQGAKELRIDEIKHNARTWKVRGEDLYKILCCDHDPAKTREIANEALKM